MKSKSDASHKLPVRSSRKSRTTVAAMPETLIYVSASTLSHLLESAKKPPFPSADVINLFKRAR